MNAKKLEAQAQQLLAYLKSDIRYDQSHLPRPFFIEFTGTPSAGKTTTIVELDKFLRRQGFRVYHPQEGTEVIRHISRSTPLYNIRTGIYALSLLVDLMQGNQYDVVIFDRCVFDAYCWMTYWKEKGKLTEEEKAVLQSFFLSQFWMESIDAAYFMTCTPYAAGERELKIAVSEILGETTSAASVTTLIARYRNAYALIKPQYPQLHLLDTTNMDAKTMVNFVVETTLKELLKKTM